MPGRTKPLRDPVTIQLDGEPIQAERGEPIAAALLAAGKLAIARSPKFHRPRGPSCMRGACDGCLARVDDRPNVMTCMAPCAEGTNVRAQNTLGSREIDLLRMTDWFFPKGMNHHELFAGVPGVQRIMQTFARRVAGLGKLPAEAVAPRAAHRRQADVVVVGGGAAGMAVAARCARAGRAVEVIDDALAVGGSLRALSGEDARPWRAWIDAFDRERGRIDVRTSTTAGAVYGDDLLVVGPHGAEIVGARALVLASGAHDGVLAFEGNDVPGVMSARAAGWLLAGGVLVGERVLVTVDGEASGPFGEAFARAVRALNGSGVACEVTVVRGAPVRVEGSARVKEVVVREGDRETRHRADALLVDAPRAPAYELCEQAGAAIAHEPRGFVPRAPAGKIRDGIFAVGEVVGTPLEPGALAAAVDEVCAQVLDPSRAR